MKCPSCGAPAQDDGAFCISCGAPLGSAPAGEKTAPGEPVEEALAAPATSTVPKTEENEPLAQEPGPGFIVDGKYEITRRLGQGGMGIVYLASDVHTGVDVVLKAVRPELAHRADIRERTLAEGRALARIDHPNVVHLNAVVLDQGRLWLVMQYIDGESLDKTITRYSGEGQRLPVTIALDVFRQVLLGVGAAHREGVIHRDLKPANILLRKKDGVAKVTDFGIAKPEVAARAGQGNTKGVIGSLWYMSPEQVSGKRDLDKRVDVYALGVVLFELMTGHVPFDAESSYELMRKQVEEPLPKVLAERKDAPPWIDEVLARACAKDRNARFGSCDEFLAAIDRHTAPRPQLTVSPAPQSSVEGVAKTHPGDTGGHATRPEKKGGSAWIWIVLLAILAGAGGTAFWFWQNQPPPKKKPTATATATAIATAPPTSPPTAPPTATATVAPPKDLFPTLVGRWKAESGREMEAVLVGDQIEFRVIDATQLAPQDYVAGEARFVITRIAGSPATFAVEDRIRPRPPEGATFDPKSRTSCLVVWTDVDDRPLRAVFDEAQDRLTVDFANIAPKASNFDTRGDVVLECKSLRNVAASRTQSVFTRP